MESAIMKAWSIRAGGGIESLERMDVPLPCAGPGEALVRMTAATLNFHDIVVAKALLPELILTAQLIPLSSATAEVVAVGDGVTGVKPGDRVNPLFGQGWFAGSEPTHPDQMLGGTTDGVAREYAAFDADNLVHVPPELSDLEAATLPVAGLTAWHALHTQRPVAPGDWVLVQGTGGVSIAALQWAKAAGAHVVVTSSSDAKLRRATALGADITVNYRTTRDWATTVRERAGHGMDLIVNNAGAAELERSARLLNEGGIVVAVGMFDGGFGWEREQIGGRKIVPVMIGHRGLHEAVIAFAATRAIHPVVDKVFSFERLPDAYRAQEAGRFIGKIGITFL
ncbi:MAG: zinc-dependent alcohol dehydrogenase family protein [Gammaproteobacteria bacterium]